MSAGSPLCGKVDGRHRAAMFTYRKAILAGMAVLGAATLEPSSGEAIDARRDWPAEAASRRSATDVTTSASTNFSTFQPLYHGDVKSWGLTPSTYPTRSGPRRQRAPNPLPSTHFGA